MKTSPKSLFRVAAGLSFAVAVFQAVITFSPSWSLYFGAPEPLTSNFPLLIVSGLVATLLFGIFGLYALSGAGDIRPLPWMHWGLVAIGGLYTLRGLAFIPLLLILWGILESSDTIPPQGLTISLVSLVIGLLYLLGTILGWKELKAKARG